MALATTLGRADVLPSVARGVLRARRARLPHFINTAPGLENPLQQVIQGEYAEPAPTHNAAGFAYGTTITLGNKRTPKGLVALMHGLGDSAKGWTSFANDFARGSPSLMFLLPTAPQRPVTVNNGALMPAWYDIKAFNSLEAIEDDLDGLKESAAYMHSLTTFVARLHGIPLTNIVYGGFSQGAVVSIFAGLTAPVRPKGILAMSGYLGGREYLSTAAKYKDVPLLVCHGDSDSLLPVSMSHDSVKLLKQLVGVSENAITHKIYPGIDHYVCPQEAVDIVDWLSAIKWDSK